MSDTLTINDRIEPKAITTLIEYSNRAYNTAQYPRSIKTFDADGNKHLLSPGDLYPFLALGGEVGEIQEKIKKIIRDDKGIISPVKIKELLKELGDVLWYVNACTRDLGFSLEEVANMNIEKLESRKERGTIQGSGDNR